MTRERSGGRLVVDALRAEGVDRVFCVPGESHLEILDALFDQAGAIRLITCRHEHGAVDMAEAHAKLTGRPGVCLVTRGPGACNASIGVHTAFQDSTPLVLLVGQVTRPHLGREAFQEVDYTRLFAPLAKWVAQADHADRVPELMARAFRHALSGRMGPAVVALPEDVLRETSQIPCAPRTRPHPAGPDAGAMERLHHMLGDADRPLMILGGSGWTETARADIAAFAAANELPTCCTFRRNDTLDNALPVFAGELGVDADPALARRVAEADLLIAVGTRLGDIATQGYSLPRPPGQGQALVHVHAEPAELGRVFPPALAIPAAMPPFAAAAARLAPVPGVRRWRDWTAAARRDFEANTEPPPAPEQGVDLGAVMKRLNAMLPNDAVVTVDAGNFTLWPQRFLRFGGGRRLLGAVNGAMGYGLPAAVAAKLAAPERVVVGICGDGGFAMTGAELATAVQEGVAPVVLVVDNGQFGTIRLHQARRYPGREIGTRLTSPDFAAWARSFGCRGETVDRTEDAEAALRHALEAQVPAVVVLKADPDAITPRTRLSDLSG